MPVQASVAKVTERIIARSQPYRLAYLARIDIARRQDVQRGVLSCANLAHGFAAFPVNDKLRLKQDKDLSVAIVSSYNDMLSAHQPFEHFPQIIK
ncbi:MAG: phosphogluconate dehydratase, partial [Glaciimonas sp.]|nr:phosphogluconate dehydratase [Glaciimonas sp.]